MCAIEPVKHLFQRCKQPKCLADECEVWVTAALYGEANVDDDPRTDQRTYLELMGKRNRWHTIHEMIRAEHDVVRSCIRENQWKAMEAIWMKQQSLHASCQWSEASKAEHKLNSARNDFIMRDGPNPDRPKLVLTEAKDAKSPPQ